MKYTLDFSEIGMKSLAETGGGIAALGEIFNHFQTRETAVQDGFSVTAEGFRHFLRHNGLAGLATAALNELDLSSYLNLESVSQKAQDRIMEGAFPEDLARDILAARARLLARCPTGIRLSTRAALAGRNSLGGGFLGNAEVVPGTANADALLAACQLCFSRAFSPGVIEESLDHGLNRLSAAVSICVQRAATGTVLLANATVEAADVLKMDVFRQRIEAHFGQAMEIEWARDGETGEFFILQVRPATSVPR